MATYYVECTGTVREVYQVEAESEADALENWDEGFCVISEADSVEPVSARLEED